MNGLKAMALFLGFGIVTLIILPLALPEWTASSFFKSSVVAVQEPLNFIQLYIPINSLFLPPFPLLLSTLSVLYYLTLPFILPFCHLPLTLFFPLPFPSLPFTSIYCCFLFSYSPLLSYVSPCPLLPPFRKPHLHFLRSLA